MGFNSAFIELMQGPEEADKLSAQTDQLSPEKDLATYNKTTDATDSVKVNIHAAFVLRPLIFLF